MTLEVTSMNVFTREEEMQAKGNAYEIQNFSSSKKNQHKSFPFSLPFSFGFSHTCMYMVSFGGIQWGRFLHVVSHFFFFGRVDNYISGLVWVWYGWDMMTHEWMDGWMGLLHWDFMSLGLGWE